jgi:hypothetical protein
MRSMLWTAILAAALLCGTAQHGHASGPEQEQTDCAFDAGPCGKTVAGLTISFDISPKPVKSMTDLTFAVTVLDRAKPVENASVMIDFTMPGMYMGKNVVRLSARGNGVYAGKGVIVRCPTGKKIWQASIAVRSARKTSVVSYVFEVL